MRRAPSMSGTRKLPKAAKIGTYEGACGEFCGIQHAAMLNVVEVMPADEFERWLATEARAQQRGTSALGESTYAGACAKCHGMTGEGFIGPPLIGNPLLQSREGLEEIIRDGRGAMPAVGEGWRERQMDALVRYLRREVGGGQGQTDGS